MGINQLVFIKSSEKDSVDIKFLSGIKFAVGINFVKTFGIGLSLQYMMIMPYDDLFHLLAPGIDIVFNLDN